MQELCLHLSVKDMELKRKIWTCFEHTIIHHTDLMQDRHLDQILMCSVYIICKVNISIFFINDADICRPDSLAYQHVFSRCLVHMLAWCPLFWYIICCLLQHNGMAPMKFLLLTNSCDFASVLTAILSF